jgi:hypothetical protein
MRTTLLAAALALLSGACDTQPPAPVALPAPPPPPAAFPSAEVQPLPAQHAPDAAPPPAASIEVVAKRPKRAAGSARAPRSFGVPECDRYARKACSCPDRILRERLCKDAHRSFGEWKKIAAHEGMRSFVVQSCKQSIRSIAAACR